MVSTTQTMPVTNRKSWTGNIVSGLPALFLLMDGVMKLFNPAPVVEAMTKLGYADNLGIPIGVFLVIATILYLIPKTAVLGAILATAHLGGAVATHVRSQSDLFSHLLPIILGVMLWGGLWFRDERIKALLPLRS